MKLPSQNIRLYKNLSDAQKREQIKDAYKSWAFAVGIHLVGILIIIYWV